MKKDISIDELLEIELKNPEFKRGYEAENTKLASSVAIYKAREDMGWTQRELAEKADVPQSTVARTERGNNVSIETLNKLAFAMGKNVEIKIS
ncbi:helix-turn-helix domain-containing protein [Companilactobacillus jidongensis]|uniref:helix-turn-helix domain-containing protein n=1 Tax=Companilactobacillus jidongensis TaxID=2486006 RepID=UPI000F782E10|nr:helix-turn-helix domain-containing protein [Companilactobacillus jidongensis]